MYTARISSGKDLGLVVCNCNYSTDEKESRGILRLAPQIARPNQCTPCKMRGHMSKSKGRVIKENSPSMGTFYLILLVPFFYVLFFASVNPFGKHRDHGE